MFVNPPCGRGCFHVVMGRVRESATTERYDVRVQIPPRAHLGTAGLLAERHDESGNYAIGAGITIVSLGSSGGASLPLTGAPGEPMRLVLVLLVLAAALWGRQAREKSA